MTRVSVSRNSRREMTQIFLSRSREANFYVSFYSRFSRIGGKVSLSPLDFQDLKIISLSFLDPFLFLLSTFKILEKISLSPLDFQYFLNEHFENWSLRMICQNSLYHFNWPLSPYCPTGSWPHPDTALCQTKIAERESSYRSDFMSCASPPIQFLTTSDGKATKSLLFSFNSRNQR